MKLRSFFRKVSRAIRSRRAIPPAELAGRIANAYQRILGRPPNADELIHWQYIIEHGCTFATIENTLGTSYEHELKRSNESRRLVDLGRFKMYVDTNDSDVSTGILGTSLYEPHVTAALLDVLKRGDTFLDVGANIGYFSLLAAAVVGQSGKVISFEPNVSNMRLLHASIVLNSFEHVQAFPLAVSDSKRILKMQSFGSNGFLDAAPTDPSNFQFVQTVILDELLEKEPRIDVIKIDIEGYESFAIKGMTQLIARHRPTLFTEFNLWHLRQRGGMEPEHFLQQLLDLDYQLSVLSFSGEVATSAPDIASVMCLLRHDKDFLDLMAQPNVRNDKLER